MLETTDRQIDALVYVLYGLTEEEIVVVEGWNHRGTERSDHAKRGFSALRVSVGSVVQLSIIPI